MEDIKYVYPIIWKFFVFKFKYCYLYYSAKSRFKKYKCFIHDVCYVIIQNQDEKNVEYLFTLHYVF
jgi:hypothetical protein